jgi:hypothetical protein
MQEPTEGYLTMRIHRNYLYVVAFISMTGLCGTGLLKLFRERGDPGFVLVLGIATLAFFFISLLCLFSPYMRINDDRIIVQHDLLRKDILFFYDVKRIEFNGTQSILVYHLNGMTKVLMYKMNAGDRKKVSSFFQELSEGKYDLLEETTTRQAEG